MKTAKDLFTLKLSHDQDERVRQNLLPVRIVLIRGNVSNAEYLLEDHPVQVFLGKKEACRLENAQEGENAGILLDFGREFHGKLRLTTADISGDDKRANVRIRFGESVMEALAPLQYKNAGNDHALRDKIYDIGFLSTTETNESGFRFVWIELEDQDKQIELQAVHLCFVYRDIPYLGSFSCSDPRLDEIWKTAAYTVHLNMQQYIWDGIKRDRLVWQGDMHTEILTIENVFGVSSVVPKTMDFLRDATPDNEWVNGYSSYTLWRIIEQAEWYRFTGDKDYLEEQRKFLKSQLALMMEYVDENGAERLPEFRFLDWQNLDNKPATHAGLQSLMKMALSEGAFLLDILGETEQADACRNAASRTAMHTPDCGGSKQAAAMMILAGLGDADKLNQDVLSPGGAHGYSTFMGYYLLAAKAKAGDYQGALDDLRAYWGGMLDLGATTFWEDFQLDWIENAGRIDEMIPQGKRDVHGDYGAFCYTGFRHSLCHGWSSGPVPFLTRHVLGIKILEPGCLRLSIAPHLGDLTWAKGTCPTPRGMVTVSHTRQADGSIKTEYTAPQGVEIRLGQN